MDCTLDLNVHQGLLCHVLACESVTWCLTFPQSRVGCNTSVQDGETPAAVGMCSRDFCSCYSRRSSNVSLKRPQRHPVPVSVCFGREAGPGLPGDTEAVTEPRGSRLCLCSWVAPVFIYLFIT